MTIKLAIYKNILIFTKCYFIIRTFLLHYFYIAMYRVCAKVIRSVISICIMFTYVKNLAIP